MSGIVNASRNNSSTSLQRQEPDRQSALRLNLNGNRLVFVNGSKWVVETSDLDVAANEMDKILDEREELEASLEEARAHIDALNKEIIETNEMKNAALGMLMEERQKSSALAVEIEAYKEELKESYRIILELKKAIPESKVVVRT